MAHRFDDAFLSAVRERSDIVEIVGRYVKLKKAGKDYTALCPFHTEKHPSFTVSAAKQFYHCFGCGAHGSVIGFLMEQGGLGFVEAVEELARNAGLTIPERAPLDPREQAEQARKAAITEVLARASKAFTQNLRHFPEAILYLKGRGIRREALGAFGIGYADRGASPLLEGVSIDLLSAAGLLAVDEDTGECRERFRQRVMFSIRNERGDVIGFGGRVMDGREPKYLNSPESVIFHKGEELFGLDLAKRPIRQDRVAIVVEGYMDVVMLWQHGEPRAVASLGTSLTGGQLSRLYRLADHVVFCFDGDKAGRAAANRAARIALGEIADGKTASFLTLPGDHDPDSYVREHGIDAWRSCLETETQPLSARLIGMLVGDRDLAVPEARAAFVRDGIEMLQSILYAPTFRDALKTEMERLASMHIRLKPASTGGAQLRRQADAAGRNEAAGADGEGRAEGPQPTAGREGFYRRYALLAALDGVAAGDVPAELRDEFSELVGGWFACAPDDAQTRAERALQIRDTSLRAVILESLRVALQRVRLLDAQGLAHEVAALVGSIGSELAQRDRAARAAALFQETL